MSKLVRQDLLLRKPCWESLMRLYLSKSCIIDAAALQKHLDSLSTWSAEWQLKFNLDKCKVMHIGHQYKTNYNVQQDNTDCSILEITEEKDLGVLTVNTMKVSRQSHEAASKANRVLGMVHRQFKDLDKKSFLIIYKGFIRPHLEYAIQAYGAHIWKGTLNTWKKYNEGRRS